VVAAFARRRLHDVGTIGAATRRRLQWNLVLETARLTERRANPP
jgi:hypothetical protein